MTGLFNRSIVVAGIAVAAFCLAASAQSEIPDEAAATQPAALNESVDIYFAELKNDFDLVVAAPALRKTKLVYTDRHFVSILKKHQTFYSLIRTNSKGVVINEVIRGATPVRDYRKIANQFWYNHVAKTHEEYQGFLKEETGRYYLFWAKPILFTTPNGTKKFFGAVAAKIDLWDCFHKISTDVDKPFLARVEGISLYAHKWKNVTEFDEAGVTIPGAQKTFIRFEKTAPPQENLAIAQTPPPPEPAAPAKRMTVLEKVDRRAIIAVAVAVGLIIIILVVRLIMQINHIMLMRRIDKSDIL